MIMDAHESNEQHNQYALPAAAEGRSVPVTFLELREPLLECCD